MSESSLQTRPQFPRLNKFIRFYRNAHRNYIFAQGRGKFPTLPYWKLLKPDHPTSPVPIDPIRAPTVPVPDVSDFPTNQVELSDDLTLVGYPQPPSELHQPTPEVTVVDEFGEAEYDKRKYKVFACPAFVKMDHTAVLTKHGRVQKTEGRIHVSRFILEEIGLQPSSGDLFQWDGKLRHVVDAYKEYGYIGSSDYWTWLEIPYEDFYGDSSNLELPSLDEADIPTLVDEQ